MPLTGGTVGPGGILKLKPSATGRQRMLFLHCDALKQIVKGAAEWKESTIVEIKRAQKVRDAARAKTRSKVEELSKARADRTTWTAVHPI